MRLLALFLSLGLISAAAGAQTPPSPGAAFAGRTIVEVHLVSEGRPADEPALLDLLETKPGQPLSLAAVRETITHLFSLGRFQDVQVDARAVNGGVALTYDLIPLHGVARVDFRGNLGVSEGDLRRFLEDRFGATPPVGRAAEFAELLERQFYPDRGYLGASVRWTPTLMHDPDRTFLTFEVDAGRRATIRNVTVVGEPVGGAAAFQREIGLSAGEAYDPAEIREEVTKYEQRLRKRGRYEARVTYAPAVTAGGGEVDLRFDVQPGPVVKVVFRGDPLPKDRIAELVPIEREGTIDEDLLEDSARRITEYLNQQGYWKASAQTSRQEENGTVTVAFTVVAGLRYFVGPQGVSITGNRQVPIEVLRPALQDLEPGDVYVAANLGAAVNEIAGIYRPRGFASLKIDTAANELNPTEDGRGQVQPAIVIAEGPQTFVGDIFFEGNSQLSSRELNIQVSSRTGDPYYEPRIESDRQAVQLEYFNAGFLSAAVTVKPVLSEDKTRADLRFQVAEGPQTIIDHVIIVGNSRTDPRIIQRELLLQPGKPLGLRDRLESQSRLAALGLFRRIRIEELPHGSPARRDVLVSVEEAAATTLSYGGGLEVTRRLQAAGPEGEARNTYEFAPRGFFDVGRRNIAGKNRSVNLFTRVGVRQNDSTRDDGTSDSGFGFIEYRFVGTYREPRALGMRAADLTVTALAEQGVRTSFNFKRLGANVDVARALGPGTRVNGRYALGTTRIFDERFEPEDPDQVTIDRLFPQVRLSSFSGAISHDTRNDVIDPSRGGLLTAQATLAARALGGEVGFSRSYTEGSWFITVPGTSRVVLAGRVGLGLADGFPRTVERTLQDGTVQAETVEDLPASERFFAGGTTTIRGFAPDAVGAPNTIDENGFPRGGNAMVVLNGELRVPVWKDVGAALFMDGGNVFNRVSEFAFSGLRGSYGAGVRYRSPLGPIRFDLGFKMDRREIGGELEPRWAVHFAVGQVF